MGLGFAERLMSDIWDPGSPGRLSTGKAGGAAGSCPVKLGAQPQAFCLQTVLMNLDPSHAGFLAVRPEPARSLSFPKCKRGTLIPCSFQGCGNDQKREKPAPPSPALGSSTTCPAGAQLSNCCPRSPLCARGCSSHQASPLPTPEAFARA